MLLFNKPLIKKMASLDSIQLKKALAKGKIVRRADDEPIAMRLRYVGTGTITSLTMTTATNFVIITSDGGTDTYTFASGSGTMGLLADNINADGVFEAKLLDCLRADVTTASNILENTTLTATTDENGESCYELHVDTDVPDYSTVCLSPFANFDAPTGHRVVVKELRYRVNFNAAVAAGVKVYRRASAPNGKKQNTEVLLFSQLSVDDTDTTVTWASGRAFITGGVDDDIIFRIGGNGAVTDTSTNFVQIVGDIE